MANASQRHGIRTAVAAAAAGGVFFTNACTSQPAGALDNTSTAASTTSQQFNPQLAPKAPTFAAKQPKLAINPSKDQVLAFVQLTTNPSNPTEADLFLVPVAPTTAMTNPTLSVPGFVTATPGTPLPDGRIYWVIDTDLCRPDIKIEIRADEFQFPDGIALNVFNTFTADCSQVEVVLASAPNAEPTGLRGSGSAFADLGH